MKIFKKAVALLLVAIFAVSLTACHPKDEVAVSVGDYKITSAMYSYFLIAADNEARNIIDSDTKINKQAENFSYYNQKIQNKPFETYVKDLALENCLNHIALLKLCNEAGVKLNDTEIANIKAEAKKLWYEGDYQTLPAMNALEPNGVGYATFEKLFIEQNYYGAYFNSLYDEGGTKAVSKETITKTLTDKYVAAYVIEHDYSTNANAKMEEVKAELQKYVDAFNEGKTYEEVKKMYDDDQKAKTEADKKEENKEESKEETKEETKEESKEETKEESKEESKEETKEESKEEDKKDENAPKDSNIKIYTNYETSSYVGYVAYFDQINKLELNKATLVEDVTNKKVYVVQKKDITADGFYLKALKAEILNMLKGKELDNAIASHAKSLQYSVNNWAIDQFKVKDIKYPEIDPNIYY